MKNKNDFYPDWFEGETPKNSYRSIFKWGNPKEYKHPNKALYKLMKETFNLTDEDFKKPKNLGLEEISYDIPIELKSEQINKFKSIVGNNNVKSDNYSRLEVAYGKTMFDAIRLREGIVENIPDLVICPRDKHDIVEIVKYCNTEKINIYIYAGGSTVTRGTEAMKKGITLDMRKHMKRVLNLNEVNHTVTVEPGIMGPDLEESLNNAPNLFKSKNTYTCGHFPQSFEYSAVGGWVVTRGAGQNSTYYGKIEDLVICQEYVTPVGIIKTGEYPAMATGPDIDQIMIGSEGAFGILISVTLKIFKHCPENTRRFSYIFKCWTDANNAIKEVMQSQFGFPSVFRLSDPDETDVALKLYGVEGTIIDKIMSIRGFKKNERCLLLGSTDGDKQFTKLVKKKIHKICKKYSAMYTTPYVTNKWEHGRFRDPYLREDLHDFGIIIDTLECALTWKQLEYVHTTVRSYCKSRPNTICMSHTSHCYPQGANLYFIFIGKFEREEFIAYHKGVLDSIQKSGAAMSHHHGIGKMFAPWLEGQIGKNQFEIFKALKKYFDPNNIMNPGGTLALDLDESEKRFNK